MKKFYFMMALMLSVFTMTINAQTQSNYAGSSKFTNNVAVTLQAGVVTPFNDYFKNGSTTPVIVLGVEKYINPWFGVALEGRTSIGTGDNYNPHTMFDAVNVSGYAKFNVLNLINGFDGTRKFFEPVVYTGLGWGHTNCGCGETQLLVTKRNYLTYRAGVEFNFNLGKDKAWGIVVNPSVVWGDICNGRLDKRNGNFEVTAGIVYHFKTSNGTHTFAKAKLYDQAEVDRLNARITELENKPAVVVEKRVEVATNTVALANNVYVVTFDQNSAALTDAAKMTLDKVGQNAIVKVAGSTSPEGTVKRNKVLAQERANAVADYLKTRGVNVESAEGGAAGRVAVVTVK